MGWWKVEGTEHVIGDGPLDILTSAAADVVTEYQSAFGRLPTPAEWEALLVTVLGAEPPEDPMTQGIVKAVSLEVVDR